MHKYQHKNTRNMKKQSSISLFKVHNSLATDFKDMKWMKCQIIQKNNFFKRSMNSKKIQKESEWIKKSIWMTDSIKR
jgi:hypothetical protein